MARLSAEQIYAVARAAGFNHDAAVTMTAIALGESGGRTEAHNPNAGTGDNSYGLWQINMLGDLGPARRQQFGISSNEELFDPYVNAKAAFIVSGGGGNFRPWTVYTRGIYRNHLSTAQAAGSTVGDNFSQFLPDGKGIGTFGSQSAASTPGGGAGGFGTATNATPALPNETPEEYARRNYGYLGWFLDHPEIGPVILDAATNQWDLNKLMGALFETDWWRLTSEQARIWDAQLASDPAEAERQLRGRIAEVEDYFAELGITVDPNKVFEIATNTLRFGIALDSAEFRNTVASQLPMFTSMAQPGAGSFAATIDQIKQLALSEYMVGIADADAWKLATDVIAGNITMDGVKVMFGDIARGRFPQLGNIFDQGITPGQFFAPYRNTIASEMELSADAVDLLDPRWAPVLGVADPNGVVRPMTLSETLTHVRKQPEWERTAKAKEKSASLTRTLIESMGRAVF